MISWSFYDQGTGLFHRRRFVGSEQNAAQNVPNGCVAIEGAFDSLSQRVDVAGLAKAVSGKARDFVVDYQPPQPSEDHEWSAERRRWIKRADVLRREAEDVKARATLAEIERAQQRAIREAVLGDAAALERLREFDRLAAVERATLQRLAESRESSVPSPLAPESRRPA